MATTTNDFITERDMLAIMAAGRIFSCTLVQYSDQRHRGGKIAHYAEAQLMDPLAERARLLGRPLTPAERQAIMDEEDQDDTATERQAKRRDPNHRGYYTRNIRIYSAGAPTGVVKKIRPPLVVVFNNKIVLP